MINIIKVLNENKDVELKKVELCPIEGHISGIGNSDDIMHLVCDLNNIGIENIEIRIDGLKFEIMMFFTLSDLEDIYLEELL